MPTAKPLPPCPVCGRFLSRHTKHMVAKHDGNTCVLAGHELYNRSWDELFKPLAAGLRATGRKAHENYKKWERDHADR